MSEKYNDYSFGKRNQIQVKNVESDSSIDTNQLTDMERMEDQ